MITILFHMTIKAEREHDWPDLMRRLYESTHIEDAGCISYTFYRQVNSPRDYVLHEQWRDEEALTAHLVRLQRLLGPAPAGGRLPVVFLDFFERSEAVRYQPAV